MPARRDRRGGLHRLHRRHDRVGAQEPSAPGGDGDGVLDGRQRAGRVARGRIRAAVQSLPAHEADHAAEDPRQPGPSQGRGRDRCRHRGAGATRGRAHGEFAALKGPRARAICRTLCAVVPAKAGTYNHRPLEYGSPLSRGRRREDLRNRNPAMTDSLLCPDAFLSPLEIDAVVARALVEDLGRAGDVTSIATIPESASARAVVVARESGVISGLPLAAAAFAKLAPETAISAERRDGASVVGKTTLMTLEGPARAVLAAERVALNLLGHLSGVATATHEFVRRVEGTRTRICCTRKTTPGLRALEKYAVRCGGGFNHRFGLDDAMLIKDNHIAVAGGIRAVLERARASAGHLVKIEIEVDTLDQLREVIAVGLADAALLDNMDAATLRQAVEMVGGRFPLEASGGITLESIAEIAKTGVDYASSGWITHSAPNLDVALDIEI